MECGGSTPLSFFVSLEKKESGVEPPHSKLKTEDGETTESVVTSTQSRGKAKTRETEESGVTSYGNASIEPNDPVRGWLACTQQPDSRFRDPRHQAACSLVIVRINFVIGGLDLNGDEFPVIFGTELRLHMAIKRLLALTGFFGKGVVRRFKHGYVEYVVDSTDTFHDTRWSFALDSLVCAGLYADGSGNGRGV